MLFGASLWLLVGMATALLVFANYYLAILWTRSVVATRRGGDCELKIGSTVCIEIKLSNRSRLPVLWVLVEDLLPRRALMFNPPALGVDGTRIQVMFLWGNQTKHLKYEMQLNRRGYFQIGPTVLETGDLMGLYRRYRVGTDPQYITVLPNIIPLAAYEIGSRRPIGEIKMRANVMDDPTRLRGIRRWQPGDPMRSVHWAATARTGTLHSKIYEPSSIAGATLILDLHTTSNPQQHEPVRSDLAITAAASIAHALHDLGEPCGLATNGRDAADRIRSEGWVGDYRVRGQASEATSMLEKSDRLRPIVKMASRDTANLREIVSTLARLERSDGLTLSELLIESESRLSSETTMLILLQQCAPESLAAILGLSRRGWAVAVMINTYDINDYSAIAGPLIAARIPTFYLSSAESIAEVCRQSILR
ncbi:hypothetical protein Q31b_09370 [Novipirellula aureliae]|uniref:DUF58 domain-containing protein n=2 Tax=Novipirellula aureliae TaxID=2527966 RepID=A0A5C6EDH4_9BACT|nr:hypothetical protein Q31b_09370 [Novipirellula aureliae]